MADEGRSGTYASTLADKKSKRLESALSSYSSDETKKAVGRLLEAYMDEGGKNYFGAGRRDTTLYFADDEYIKEIENEKSPKGIFKGGKKNVHTATEDKDKEKKSEVSQHKAKEPDEGNSPAPVVSEPTIVMDDAAIKQIRAAEAEDSGPLDTPKEEQSDKEEAAVDNGDKSTEEETPEMKHNGEYDEVEEEAVPRRRRSQPADVSEQKPKKKPAPPVEEEEDEDDYDDLDDFDEDYDEDDYDEEEKGGLFSIFKKKRSDDDEDFDEDEYEEYDDEEYDDEYDDFDDDEYEEESAISVKKIFHVIFVVLLICAVAALAAMCYSYKNNYDSAKKQIEDQLQSSEDGKSPAEQINELKAQVEQLKAENEKLKSGTSGTGAADSSTAGANTNGSDTTADGAPSSVVDDTSGATSANSGSTYVVQAGDNTGAKLCRNIYGEYTPELWQKLCEANGKSGADFVVGEEIIVP